MDIKEIVLETELENAYGNANFGPHFTPRDVLRLTLLKCACGYASGHTAKVIVEELRLVKNWKLTAKGKLYLWNCFETNNF